MLVGLLLICITVLAKYNGRDACKLKTGVCDGPLTTAGCATCTEAGVGQTCLTCTAPSHKVRPDEKGCIAACPEGVSTDVDGFCECKNGYQPSASGETCELDACNTPNCKTCDNPKTDREVCTECNDGNYLTPTSQCVPDCTAIKGYYGDTDKKCKKCHDTCAECVGPADSQCSACPAGKSLEYGNSIYPNNGGTCGDACKTTGGSTGCKVCGSTIGEALYCSQCNNNNQAPLNGNCAANARTRFCTKMGTGACTQCAADYFLKDGGCYETISSPVSRSVVAHREGHARHVPMDCRHKMETVPSLHVILLVLRAALPVLQARVRRVPLATTRRTVAIPLLGHARGAQRRSLAASSALRHLLVQSYAWSQRQAPVEAPTRMPSPQAPSQASLWPLSSSSGASSASSAGGSSAEGRCRCTLR
ncbi:VSP with INR [Giardia lamblia P15]|uniref:VSP with INR n=1 Tax=Giardia intestinalis (strain P15) TaxID=658858 RepID=E1F6Q9_GIAIA|nr:VSP with INR [Giardia lamblia P15]